MKKLIAITGYCMLLACCIYAQELSNDELLSIANSFLAQMNDSNINQLPQGMYILRAVTSESTSHQAKFIKE